MQAPAANQVQVNVKHGLAGAAIGIEDGAEAALGNPALARNRGRPPHHFADNLIVLGREVVERGDVLLRHHQHVRRPLRVDIVERQHTVVVVDDGGGQTAGGNAAKQTAVFSHQSPVVGPSSQGPVTVASSA